MFEASFRRVAPLVFSFALFTVPALKAGASSHPLQAPVPSAREQSQQEDQKKPDSAQEGGSSQSEASDRSSFTDQDAKDLLADIRDGLETHTQRLMLSAFDREKMEGYISFEDQVQAFFQRYEAFRVHFRIIQRSQKDGKGIVLAEFQVEGSPRGGGPMMRRTSQVRLELQRGKKGWKIVDVNPRGFFA